MGKSKVIVCQFAGFHTVLPVLFTKLFNVKTIIITGGTDCVSFPSINYGNYRGGALKWVTTFTLKNCSKISSIHEALIYSKNTYFIDEKESLQGYKHHIKNIKTTDEVIYNGYSGEIWYRDLNIQRGEKTYLTAVGKYYDRIQFLKGFDMIIEAAATFPDATFIILGVSETQKQKVHPKNVEFYPVQNREELFKWYNRASFYFQLSISEGFPNALCEAMLCECIPIVSGVSSMPEIVNDCGFVVKTKSMATLNQIISESLNLSSEEKNKLAKNTRGKILSKYTFENRKTKLLNLIDKVSQS